MLYFVSALSAEAKPIIDFYDLKRIHSLPYTLFENGDIKLIITGIGSENAMLAVSAFLGHFPPKKGDLLLNVGICAAPKEFAIGKALLAHKITYESPFEHKERSCYPDILFEHDLEECELLCVDAPAHQPLHLPTDMESYGIYKAASRFFGTHALLFFKVVSDHFEPLHVNKENAVKLIFDQLPAIKTLIGSAQFINYETPLFDQKENELFTLISEHLTKAQSDSFYDACCYYKLHRKKKIYEDAITPPITKLTKQERSTYFEQLVKTLTL